MKPNHTKTALVTGGTSGIGMQIALLLIRKGAKVIVAGRNFETIENTLNAIPDEKKNWHFVRSDLRNDKDLHHLINEVKKKTDRLDFLIHSAGVFYSGNLENATIENLDELYQVNTRAPYFLTHGLVELLKMCKGRIVFINSTAGLDSWKSIGQYAASKHALSAIAGSFQAELENYGIKITSVYPAATNTPMQKKIHESEGKTFNPDTLLPAEEVADITVDLLWRTSKSVVSEIVIRSVKGRLINKQR